MKKFKKASALILSGALIAGTFSAMLTANAAKSETIGSGTALASYENDFNADDLSSALGDDFEIRYDHENWISAIPRKLTVSEADDYADLLDGQIVRINNASESQTDGMRAYWQQLYFYYKKQTFKNFEFSVDLTSTHDGFEMIHFAPAVDGSIYSSGFTLATKYNAFKKQYDLFLGNAAEAVTDLDFFYIKQESTAAHTSITGKEKTVNIKITFNDGTAVAYIDGEKVLEKTGLEQIEYYPAVTLGYNLAADWQGSFDNFKIAEIEAASTFERVEQCGIYSNNFNVSGLNSIITKDFNLYYDTSDTTANSLANITTEPSKYMTFANNRLERVHDESELSPGTDGNRPYWCMAYYTYKNQAFKNFTLTVDAYLPTWGSNYNAITVGSMGGGLKSNGGFTLGFYNGAEDALTVYLGNAADVAANFDDWYVHDCTGKSTYAHESGSFNYQITLTVSGGKATVSINGTTVLTDIEVGEVSGYVSLVNGLASGSYYDNLSIISTDESTFARTEESGKYSNNFDVSGLNSIITKDFNLYYDTSDTAANSLTNINTDPSKYITFANNRLERVRDESELYPWTDGNRPYWCMAYYTYKNQVFKDFTLTVDAYLPTWGSNYNAITVGSMGGGLKSNGGFTLGFYNGAEDALTVYLGNAADVAVNFDDWYVHDCDGKRVYNHGADQKDYKITLTVFGGMATVKINDVVLFEDFYVGYLDGYISLVNGLVATGESSYYDNLKIEAITDNGSERNADINLNVIPYSEYTAVSLITDTSLTHINTAMDLSFDNNNFEYAGTVIEADNIRLNSNREIKSEGGNVNLSLLCATNGKIATLYFKNINNTNDFSAFKIKNAKTTLLNGHPVNGEAKLTVKGDYSADKIINIIDLVKGKKLSANNDNSVKSEDLVALRKALLGTCDKIEISPLLGKSALYLGDSIAYGAGDALGLSWAGRIAQRGMVYENVAVSGWALTKTEISGRLQIVTQLDSAKKSDYDFVILEGGVNDVLINERESEHPISFGEITSDGTEFDTATICGAIEDLIVKTKAKFPNAKVGYIINNYFGATEDDMTKYINAVKTACDKHGIDYVDLYNDEYVKANFNNEKHLPDSLHPNAAGYDILSEVIADWMETIAEK